MLHVLKHPISVVNDLPRTLSLNVSYKTNAA
jgi:hypothetical protein